MKETSEGRNLGKEESRAAEARLDQRNCHESQHRREERVDRGWGRLGRDQRGNESEVNYLRLLMWDAAEMRTLPAGSQA